MRNAPSPLARRAFDTPIGLLLATVSDAGLTRLQFEAADPAASAPSTRRQRLHLDHLSRELDAYFAGQLRAFTVPIEEGERSPFTSAVWAYLRAIPFGQTRSYGQQAAAIGRPTATRAVGMVNGRNPLCIVTPCHRVIGADGSLTGFASGIERKRWLLDHERRIGGGGDTYLFN